MCRYIAIGDGIVLTLVADSEILRPNRQENQPPPESTVGPMFQSPCPSPIAPASQSVACEVAPE
jgi:hypothetical protein